MSDKLLLNEVERMSPVFMKLKDYYAARLQRLRVQNDADKPADKTAALRGRIAECKAFLALDNPAPESVANDDE